MRKAEMVVLSDSVAINTCCDFQWGSGFLVSLVAFFSDRQGPGHHFKEGANENWKYFLACSTVLPKRRILASTEWTLREAGLVLLEQLRWDFRSGSSVGQVTGEGHRERAQGHHVHHLAHLQTMWNFLWDWKTPDVAHLESVASRFPGPIFVFNMQWVLRTVWTFLELADLGELEVKKKRYTAVLNQVLKQQNILISVAGREMLRAVELAGSMEWLKKSWFLGQCWT